MVTIKEEKGRKDRDPLLQSTIRRTVEGWQYRMGSKERDLGTPQHEEVLGKEEKEEGGQVRVERIGLMEYERGVST